MRRAGRPRSELEQARLEARGRVDRGDAGSSVEHSIHSDILDITMWPNASQNHLPVKSVHTVEISDFVKLEEVDPIYYDKAYYLAPEETGAKAFALLRQALEQTGRAAVAKVAIRDKENLCLVRPYGDVLSMETMFY